MVGFENVYVADSESLTGDITETRTWAWGITKLCGGDAFHCVETFNEIVQYVDDGLLTQKIIYVHNLKHDGSFILSYIHSLGYVRVDDTKELVKGTYLEIIDETTTFYKITICLDNRGKNKNTISIYDSYKLIPMSVADMSKAFGLSCSKGEIDYLKYREVGYKPTDEELDYIKRDVFIVRDALLKFFEYTGCDSPRLTLSSVAYSDWLRYIPKTIEIEGVQDVKGYLLPQLDDDMYYLCKDAYRGGFVYLNSKYKCKTINQDIYKYDINSSFPNVMRNCKLPYGKPRYLTDSELGSIAFNMRGELCYTDDKTGQLVETTMYIGKCNDIVGNWNVKPNCVPCYPINHALLSTEYSEFISLDYSDTFTGVDIQTFFNCYFDMDPPVIDPDCGYTLFMMFSEVLVFEEFNGLFDYYIDYWISKKIEADQSGNKALRTIAKLMLNSVYGKLGLNPVRYNKKSSLDEDGALKFEFDYEIDGITGEYLLDDRGRKIIKSTTTAKNYIPIASFITAYARQHLIYAIQKNIDSFVYCDTDSMHLLSQAKDVELNATKLGAWKFEGISTKSKYIRTKCYLQHIDGENLVTVAGLPKKLHHKITFDNFNTGLTVGGKLVPKQVKGGAILVETEFTLNAR